MSSCSLKNCREVRWTVSLERWEGWLCGGAIRRNTRGRAAKARGVRFASEEGVGRAVQFCARKKPCFAEGRASGCGVNKDVGRYLQWLVKKTMELSRFSHRARVPLFLNFFGFRLQLRCNLVVIRCNPLQSHWKPAAISLQTCRGAPSNPSTQFFRGG